MTDQDRDLVGKTAVVTGAGRNTGRAIVIELAEKGANVIVNARSNVEEAETVAKEARSRGVEAVVVLGDVAKQETIDAIAAAGRDRFGHIDISVSNAAFRPFQSFLDMPIEDWLHVLDYQLNASFRLAKAVVPGMIEQGWGRIIHITGPDAFVGRANRAHNVAGKGGIRGLTKSLAIELGQFGITVNDVAPGNIETVDNDLSHPRITQPLLVDGVAQASGDAEWKRRQIEGIPVRRQGRPEDVAYAVGWLASPRSGFYSGTVMCCCGGDWMVP